MNRLMDTVTVITGGNSGIGLSIAKLFKHHGSSIVIFGRNKETLKIAVESLGANTLAIQGDVCSMSDIDNLCSKTLERFGKIDSLIVNAGEGQRRTIEDIDEPYFDKICNVNFKGAYFTVHKFIPLLKEGGSVTFISSIANVKAIHGLAIYSAAKAAVRSLARSLSAELAPRKIRVNSISPGGVNTPFLYRDGSTTDQVYEAIQQFNDLIPLNRLAHPDEIATAALFLTSRDSSYITGEDIAVDGGFAQI